VFEVTQGFNLFILPNGTTHRRNPKLESVKLYAYEVKAEDEAQYQQVRNIVSNMMRAQEEVKHDPELAGYYLTEPETEQSGR